MGWAFEWLLCLEGWEFEEANLLVHNWKVYSDSSIAVYHFTGINNYRVMIEGGGECWAL